MVRMTRSSRLARGLRSACIPVLLSTVTAACGAGGGSGGGPPHNPLYLSGDVEAARIDAAGGVSMIGHGGELGPLALALAFSGSPDLTIGYDARELPPLADPYAIALGPAKGAFDISVAPEEVFSEQYVGDGEQILVTARGGMSLLVDARSLVSAPVVDGNLVHFQTSEHGKFSAVVDKVDEFDGQKLVAFQPITDFSIDADGDGVAAPLDCNDSDPSISPLATEIPNDGIDQNCDGLDIPDEDHDGYGSAAFPGGTDCNDQDPKVNPGATEVPSDGIDNNCDGIQVNDDDHDGFVHNIGGTDPGPDCDDEDPTTYPGAPEVFGGGKDHNCNGIIPGNTIMGEGDSVTAGFGDPVYDSNPDAAGYLPRLADLLGVPRDAMDNRGRPSTVSADGVDHIDHDLAADHPDLVIVLFGANDSLEGVTVHDFTDNMRQIISRVQVSGAKAIISGITHVCCGREGPPVDERNAYIDELNAALIPVASDTGSLFVDMEQAFQTHTGSADISSLLFDGLHPNASGYDVMAQTFADVITTQEY